MKILAIAALGLAGAAVAGMVAHAGATTKTVKVTEREYHISLSTKKSAAGPVRFVIKNTGHLPHALAVTGPGVSKRTHAIRPGKSATLTVTLKNGTYTIWCPMPGHAALGMKATFKAGAASSAPPATTSAGTTTGTETIPTDTGPAWG